MTGFHLRDKQPVIFNVTEPEKRNVFTSLAGNKPKSQAFLARQNGNRPHHG